MKHPNLDGLEVLLTQADEIRMSDNVYEERTGARLPKDNWYLMKKSALSRWAEDHGYEIVEVSEVPVIEKTVVMKRKRCENG